MPDNSNFVSSSPIAVRQLVPRQPLDHCSQLSLIPPLITQTDLIQAKTKMEHNAAKQQQINANKFMPLSQPELHVASTSYAGFRRPIVLQCHGLNQLTAKGLPQHQGNRVSSKEYRNPDTKNVSAGGSSVCINNINSNNPVIKTEKCLQGQGPVCGNKVIAGLSKEAIQVRQQLQQPQLHESHLENGQIVYRNLFLNMPSDSVILNPVSIANNDNNNNKASPLPNAVNTNTNIPSAPLGQSQSMIIPSIQTLPLIQSQASSTTTGQLFSSSSPYALGTLASSSNLHQSTSSTSMTLVTDSQVRLFGCMLAGQLI